MAQVIIQGVPRSGTTIMLSLFVGAKGVDKIFNETEQLPPTSGSWAYKRPSYCLRTVEFLDKYPDAKIVLIVRHGLDVLASALRYWKQYGVRHLSPRVRL